MDLASQLNVGKEVYFSRTDKMHGRMLTVFQYKYNRKLTEVAALDDPTNVAVIQRAIIAVKDASWLGLISIYFARVPGPLSIKIPVIFFFFSSRQQHMRSEYLDTNRFDSARSLDDSSICGRCISWQWRTNRWLVLGISCVTDLAADIRGERLL